MSRYCGSCLMRPLPMVPATLVPNKNAATKLKNAAQMTACVGESTRVETTVAIEFAASWNPLKKSKPRATRITRTRAVVTTRSGVLQHDRLEGVGDVLATVDGALELVDQVLPLEDVHGLVVTGEQ